MDKSRVEDVVDIVLWAVIAGLIILLSGCEAYYQSGTALNKAMFENPRVYKFSCEKCDGVRIEVPLDAHKMPVEMESPGKQVAGVIKAGETLGIVGFISGLFGGSDRSSYVEKSSSTKETFIKDTTSTSITAGGQ